MIHNRHNIDLIVDKLCNDPNYDYEEELLDGLGDVYQHHMRRCIASSFITSCNKLDKYGTAWVHARKEFKKLLKMTNLSPSKEFGGLTINLQIDQSLVEAIQLHGYEIDQGQVFGRSKVIQMRIKGLKLPSS